MQVKSYHITSPCIFYSPLCTTSRLLTCICFPLRLITSSFLNHSKHRLVLQIFGAFVQQVSKELLRKSFFLRTLKACWLLLTKELLSFEPLMALALMLNWKEPQSYPLSLSLRLCLLPWKDLYQSHKNPYMSCLFLIFVSLQ